jgi:hypothetical protein
MFIVAQVAPSPASGGGLSAGLLGAILSGSLIGAIIAAYRFAVNYRTTERGMRAQATRDKRLARHEAGLWQARCADLEYELRRRGHPVPKLDPELRRLVDSADEEIPTSQWDNPQQPDERLER